MFTVADETTPAVRDDARALEIAALTRAAYTGSDPLPGLPPPDGSFETADDVLRDLASGQRLWAARDSAGHAVAALRTVTRATSWEVRRVSVLPAWQGRGVTRALIDHVQRAAREERIPSLCLDAVVERCLPDLYRRLGFRPVRVFRAGDKPMTEWHMERGHDDPSPPAAAPAGLHLRWYVAHGRLLASVDHRAGETSAPAAPPSGLPVGARLAGVDVLPGAGPGDLGRLSRHLGPGTTAAEGLYALGRARAEVPFHLLPRSYEPRLICLARHAPGREPLLHGPTPTEKGEHP
ncbi:GNAT family N-acetyltransferase [Streptomyces sp. NPDC020141]|uniref:GNAT family N-acetyltransferase n=1 Tax=Streptomyces sp. NPDC020141 TaxID=3365065 RepID=UPI0037BA758A